VRVISLAYVPDAGASSDPGNLEVAPKCDLEIKKARPHEGWKLLIKKAT